MLALYDSKMLNTENRIKLLTNSFNRTIKVTIQALIFQMLCKVTFESGKKKPNFRVSKTKSLFNIRILKFSLDRT